MTYEIGHVQSLSEAEQTARYAVKHGHDRTGAIGLLLAEYDALRAMEQRARQIVTGERVSSAPGGERLAAWILGERS